MLIICYISTICFLVCKKLIYFFIFIFFYNVYCPVFYYYYIFFPPILWMRWENTSCLNLSILNGLLHVQVLGVHNQHFAGAFLCMLQILFAFPIFYLSFFFIPNSNPFPYFFFHNIHPKIPEIVFHLHSIILYIPLNATLFLNTPKQRGKCRRRKKTFPDKLIITFTRIHLQGWNQHRKRKMAVTFTISHHPCIASNFSSFFIETFSKNSLRSI